MPQRSNVRSSCISSTLQKPSTPSTMADSFVKSESFSLPTISWSQLQNSSNNNFTFFQHGRHDGVQTLNTQSRLRSHLQSDTSLVLRSSHRMLQIQDCSQFTYLGLHLNQRITWPKQVDMKRQQQNLKLRKTSWLLGSKSTLAVSDKIVPYKIIIKTKWAYGIQAWGCVPEPLSTNYSKPTIQDASGPALVRNQPNTASHMSNMKTEDLPRLITATSSDKATTLSPG